MIDLPKGFLAGLAVIATLVIITVGTSSCAGALLDARDRKEDAKLERANAACGTDKTAEFDVGKSGKRYWYKVTCVRPDGSLYLVVIRW